MEEVPWHILRSYLSWDLKGLSHEIDFKNVDENGQILALKRVFEFFEDSSVF